MVARLLLISLLLVSLFAVSMSASNVAVRLGRLTANATRTLSKHTQTKTITVESDPIYNVGDSLSLNVGDSVNELLTCLYHSDNQNWWSFDSTALPAGLSIDDIEVGNIVGSVEKEGTTTVTVTAHKYEDFPCPGDSCSIEVGTFTQTFTIVVGASKWLDAIDGSEVTTCPSPDSSFHCVYEPSSKFWVAVANINGAVGCLSQPDDPTNCRWGHATQAECQQEADAVSSPLSTFLVCSPDYLQTETHWCHIAQQVLALCSPVFDCPRSNTWLHCIPIPEYNIWLAVTDINYQVGCYTNDDNSGCAWGHPTKEECEAEAFDPPRGSTDPESVFYGCDVADFTDSGPAGIWCNRAKNVLLNKDVVGQDICQPWINSCPSPASKFHCIFDSEHLNWLAVARVNGQVGCYGNTDGCAWGQTTQAACQADADAHGTTKSFFVCPEENLWQADHWCYKAQNVLRGGYCQDAYAAAPDFFYAPVTVTSWHDMATIKPSVTTFGSGDSCEWSAPSLPKGLSLDAKTGEITGKPKDSKQQTSYPITCTNNEGLSTTSNLDITVKPQKSNKPKYDQHKHNF